MCMCSSIVFDWPTCYCIQIKHMSWCVRLDKTKETSQAKHALQHTNRP